MKWGMVKEVAWREIVTRSRTKSFRWITGILVAAAVVAPIAAAVIPESGDEARAVTIGMVDVDEATKNQIVGFAAGNLDVTILDLTGSSSEQVDAALSDGEIDVALEAGPTLVWNRQADAEIANLVFAVMQQQDVLLKGRALGLDQSQIAELLSPPEMQERFAHQVDGIVTFVAFFGLMAAFMLPQIYGQLAMMSVIEEKSTRVIEVLLNHLRPRTLLLGKVIGVGALAVAQLVVVIGGLTAALLLTDAIEIPGAVWRFVPIMMISTLGGLAIYNTFFALLGSLISRQEDASQVMMPIFVPLIAGFFVGQAAIEGDAQTALVKVLTWFPLTAPMLLPLRVARDAIAPWEIAVSLGLLVGGVWLLVRIAGRVYEFTLLHTGSRVTWRQLARLSRGATFD